MGADDDDVTRRGDADTVPGVVDHRCRNTATVCVCSRRRRRSSDVVCAGGRALTRSTTCYRRQNGTNGYPQILAVNTSSTTTDALSCRGRTLLATGDDAHCCDASRPLLDVRLTRVVRSSDSSVLRRTVSAAVLCRQYARSRRRRRRRRWVNGSPDGADPWGGGPSVAAFCLLAAAALLVGSVAADPRRYHGESSHSAAAHSRQLALPQSSADDQHRVAEPPAPRHSAQSDDIGAGMPCIYEGHIKTDR